MANRKLKIYKPVEKDALNAAGVENEEEFAHWFAGSIQKNTGSQVTGTYDGRVHLEFDSNDMVGVGLYLDDLNLNFIEE